jgi:hypothetical protein
MSTPGKVMLTMFWDSQGVLTVHFQKHDGNVNSASYCEVVFEVLGCKSQKTFRPTGKRGTASS